MPTAELERLRPSPLYGKYGSPQQLSDHIPETQPPETAATASAVCLASTFPSRFWLAGGALR